MKLLVFAHIPPPHHGQSYMVKLMLDGFGGDQHGHRTTVGTTQSAGRFGITCYHVDARLSRNLEDIGEFRLQKVFLLLGYCLQAICAGFDTALQRYIMFRRQANGRHWFETGWSCGFAVRSSGRLSFTGTPQDWRSGWKPSPSKGHEPSPTG